MDYHERPGGHDLEFLDHGLPRSLSFADAWLDAGSTARPPQRDANSTELSLRRPFGLGAEGLPGPGPQVLPASH